MSESTHAVDERTDAPVSDPDGTDSRILSPDDNEPEVTVARGNSTGKTYHTTDCPIVRRINDPNHVPKSVAEWKGYTKCKRCDEVEGGEGYTRPDRSYADEVLPRPHRISRIKCLKSRALLLQGGTRRGVAEQLDIGEGTVQRHRSGSCSCEHDAHAVEYDGGGYARTDDGGIPTRVNGRTPISVETCAALRDTLARGGVHAVTLAHLFGVSESATRRHVAGECNHDHDTAPVTFDAGAQAWRRVADAPTDADSPDHDTVARGVSDD